MPSTVHLILEAARDLIKDPKHWTQGHAARDEFGSPTESTYSDAVCWCSLGAVNKSATRFESNERFAAMAMDELDKAAAFSNKGTSMVDLNDKTDHATVLLTFSMAIAATATSQRGV
jgi:hypothetical protein